MVECPVCGCSDLGVWLGRPVYPLSKFFKCNCCGYSFEEFDSAKNDLF